MAILFLSYLQRQKILNSLYKTVNYIWFELHLKLQNMREPWVSCEVQKPKWEFGTWETADWQYSVTKLEELPLAVNPNSTQLPGL